MKNFPLITLLLFFFTNGTVSAQYPQLDISFNNNGVYESDLFFSHFKVQPDEKILAIGKTTRSNESDSQVELIRLNPDNGLDNSFGVDGVVDLNFGEKVFLQEDGKIIIGGTTTTSEFGDVTSVMSLVRLNSNGDIDKSFGNEGYVHLDNATERLEDDEEVAGGTNTFKDLAFHSDGRIVIVGHSTFPFNAPNQAIGLLDFSAFSTFRLQPNGDLDLNYGIDGKNKIDVLERTGKIISSYPVQVEVLHNDNIIISGKGIFDLEELTLAVLIRLHENGEIDDNFNEGKHYLPPLHHTNRAENMIIQNDGSIIVDGVYWSWDTDNIIDYIIMKVNPNGSIDGSFGNNGKVVFSGNYDFVTDTDIISIPGEDIFAVGSNLPLKKVKADGSVDEFFNTTVKGNYLALQDPDKLLVLHYNTITRLVDFKEAENEVATVQKFTLINAETDEVIYDVGDGTNLNLSTLDATKINIQVHTRPEQGGSIKLELSGSHNLTQIENTAPYALFGNNGDDFFSWKPETGEYTLTATPYSEKNASGVAGVPESISFTIIDIVIPGVSEVVLIDADTDTELFDLTTSRNQFNLQEIGTKNINIRAKTTPEPTGSVKFILEGPEDETYTHIENNAPYALYGNNGNDYFKWPVKPGIYRLRIYTYTEAGTEGLEGYSISIPFEVWDEPVLSIKNIILVNAETNEELFEIEDGHQINLHEIGTNEINIKVITEPEVIGSVEFALSGERNYRHTENTAPYALFENSGNIYKSWIPQSGNYRLVVAPYSKPNSSGKIWPGKIIYFSILNQNTENFKLSNAYPNPGNQTVHIPIKKESSKIHNVKVYGLDGKDVNHLVNISQKDEETIMLDVSSLEKRTYIIKVASENEVKNILWTKE